MSLANSRKLVQLCLKNHTVLYQAVRTHFNKDYKPAPYPKTAEERAAAAKKYGLILEEYKPFPDNGNGLGDYPQIPNISGDAKDNNYPWDNPELKRNFNETMNANADFFGEDRYDISFRHRISLLTQLGQFCLVMFGTYGLYYILENVKMFPALVPKQYPHQGKTHYTFKQD